MCVFVICMQVFLLFFFLAGEKWRCFSDCNARGETKFLYLFRKNFMVTLRCTWSRLFRKCWSSFLENTCGPEEILTCELAEWSEIICSNYFLARSFILRGNRALESPLRRKFYMFLGGQEHEEVCKLFHILCKNIMNEPGKRSADANIW